MSEEFDKKIQDIQIIINEINEFPQTYDSLLYKERNERNVGTYNTILRRKLNNCILEGRVCKTGIPGTRFGKMIFYTLTKKYKILVLAGRAGSEVYVLFNYEHVSKYYIKFNKYWILHHGLWEEHNEEKTLFEGSVLLFL